MTLVCRPTPFVRFMHSLETWLKTTPVSHGTTRGTRNAAFIPLDESQGRIAAEVGKSTGSTGLQCNIEYMVKVWHEGPKLRLPASLYTYERSRSDSRPPQDAASMKGANRLKAMY